VLRLPLSSHCGSAAARLHQELPVSVEAHRAVQVPFHRHSDGDLHGPADGQPPDAQLRGEAPAQAYAHADADADAHGHSRADGHARAVSPLWWSAQQRLVGAALLAAVLWLVIVWAVA
jgi:hypothetical protein